MCTCVRTACDVKCGLSLAHHTLPYPTLFVSPYLIHLDVVAVEVEAGNPVLHVRLPPHGLRPQVEELNVTVVVAGRQAAVFVCVSVAERNGPAISRRLSARNGRG